MPLPLSRTAKHKAELPVDSKLPTPILKETQDTTDSEPRSHEFPANSIESLDRDMREAESTTTTTAQSATESSAQTAAAGASGEAGQEEPTGPESASQLELRQLLKDYYYSPDHYGLEKPGNFFMFFDLFRTGPFSDNGDAIRSSSSINHHKGVCDRAARNLNTDRQSSDLCHWTYTCNFSENRFPTAILNATSCTAGDGAECVQRIQPIMTFTRTYDSIGQATWARTGDINIVYGYTCRRR